MAAGRRLTIEITPNAVIPMREREGELGAGGQANAVLAPHYYLAGAKLN